MIRENLASPLKAQLLTQQKHVEKPSITHKIVLLGDMGVGKTSISIRYYSGEFSEQHEATIGGCFLTKDVPLEAYTVKFEIWDTAG